MVSYQAADGAFSGLARLYSPSLGRTSQYCEFEFYYYKVDSEPKSNLFSLFLVDSFGAIERLWKTDENSPNNDWSRMSVGLHSRDPGFKLYFESAQLSQFTSQRPLLAIDDTNYINCQTQFNVTCSSRDVFRCNNTNCITRNFVCDFNNDCYDMSDEDRELCSNYTRCNFDSGLNSLCQWNNDNDADLQWKRAIGVQFLSTNLNYPTFGKF